MTNLPHSLPPGRREHGDPRSSGAELHDAALRWRTGGAAAEGDGGNVIVFHRARRDAPARTAPAVAFDPATRPLAALAQDRGARWLALLAASAAIHIGLYLPFRSDPAPMASIGLETISVELVLGANEDAGLTRDKGTSEASMPAPMQTPEAVDEPQKATEPPVEVATLIAPAAEVQPEAPPPVAAAERAPAPVAAATAIETAPQVPTPDALPAAPTHTGSVTAAVHPPANPVEPPPVQAAIQPPEQTTEAKPVARRTEPRREVRKPHRPSQQAKLQGERNESDSTAPASAAAGGVGRGRSDSNTNYRGVVAAHLARYKQFPADARSRGASGNASVSFALDGGGRVTSVSLAHSSGVPSLDQETVAMVRRASPFPAPPNGQRVSFTVPVSFRLW